jgi:hypothetical protein
MKKRKDSIENMSRREYQEMCERVCRKINFKDCSSPQEIKDTLKTVQKNYERKREERGAKRIENLRSSGFAQRFIEDAIDFPRGFCANVINFGYRTAKAKQFERAREKIRNRFGRRRF